MPFYEYKPLSGPCPICKGRFQDLQKISDPPHKWCPDCKRPCERVISAPMISVKGSEFRNSERSEIQRFNQSLFDQKKAQIDGNSQQEFKGRPLAADVHAHHDCAALGCFANRPAEEVERLVEQSESKRQPYMIKWEKK